MDKIEKISVRVRKNILKMHNRANSAHIGSSLSAVDILTALFFGCLKIKSAKDPDRDRLILSKGHGASALYAVLAEKGYIPLKSLKEYCMNGGRLCGHADCTGGGGIEASTGSLGHGLPLGCGMAYAAKKDKKPYRVFVVMGDGECNEGSVWEAALFASHHKLDNLTVIVDRNGLQGMGRTEDVLRLEPFLSKWRSFGWHGTVINGHDHAEISKTAGKTPFKKACPSIIIANTVKGKGISFMEDRLEWHYKSPTNEQYEKAVAELDGKAVKKIRSNK